MTFWDFDKSSLIDDCITCELRAELGRSYAELVCALKGTPSGEWRHNADLIGTCVLSWRFLIYIRTWRYCRLLMESRNAVSVGCVYISVDVTGEERSRWRVVPSINVWCGCCMRVVFLISNRSNLPSLTNCKVRVNRSVTSTSAFLYYDSGSSLAGVFATCVTRILGKLFWSHTCHFHARDNLSRIASSTVSWANQLFIQMLFTEKIWDKIIIVPLPHRVLLRPWEPLSCYKFYCYVHVMID